MTWEKLISNLRWGREEEQKSLIGNSGSKGAGRRSYFEQDYDRLVFSTAFRRLQNKAQVFPLPSNVFVHNRLTHSLEVSCVARSLGSICGEQLEEKYGDLSFTSFDLSSIVATAALAHDLGNPPFGHSGERAISSYFAEGEGMKWKNKVRKEGGRWEDFLHFEGNANTFRLLTHTFVGRRKGGFSLTYTTLAATVKYPCPSTQATPSGKFGFFEPEERTYRQVANHLGLESKEQKGVFFRHPLVYLVEAADDICYEIMDLEDAYKLKILSYDEVKKLMLGFFAETEELSRIKETIATIEDRNEKVAYMRSNVINKLVGEVSEIFIQNEPLILSGAFKGSLIQSLEGHSQQAYKAATRTAYNRIYSSHDVVDVELAGHRIFAELIDRMMFALENPQSSYSAAFLRRVSSQYDTRVEGTYGKLLTTLDYISGMTDLYALNLYRNITGMNLPHA